jgi:hypothetical protein
LTLDDVAKACKPRTTAQTIGRLETGTRTVSVSWLNRIADALGVEASDLVQSGESPKMPVAALLTGTGATAPKRQAVVVAPRVQGRQVAVSVSAGVGEYRSGDEIWCDMLEPDEFSKALNRDVLVPRAAGRFLFGRLIGREASAGSSGKLHLLPPESGGRQTVVTDPPWIAMASRLIRSL